MSTYTIGLTGGIGCGKTTVSDMFSQLGAGIVDADIVAREVVEPGTHALESIRTKFGRDILSPDGYLDRQALRSIVFSNDEHLKWLNKLLHPLIRQSIESRIANCKKQYCILVAPLLIENKLLHLVDRVLVIDIDEALQLERTSQRDPSSIEEIKRIISKQSSRSERLEKADDVLDNNSSDIEILRANVEKLHQKYIEIAEEA